MKVKLLLLTLSIASLLRASDYHVDCASGDDSATGLTPATAWKSVNAANAVQLIPGDRLLFLRGGVCPGVLTPKGSGTAAQPIVISTYGVGALPVIDAKGAPAAISLNNQSWVHISQLAATGSTEYGIFLGVNAGVARGLRLTDVQAFGVRGPLKKKSSGLIVAVASGEGIFNDLVIDGATVWDTTQWSGINVTGAAWSSPPVDRRSTGVVIRNSIAHDVWGDAIVLFEVRDGVIERSAAWNSGMQPSYTIGTPNGIWTWRCAKCVVRASESFFADSPGVDGGAFDIDWGNDNNVVESSFGHDTQAYCIAVFGAENLTTTGSIIRDNLCAGNGRSPRLARHHGAVHLFTWANGKLDGVRITGNTIVWTPPIGAPLINSEAAFTGDGATVVENNVFLAAATEMLKSTGNLALEKNRHEVAAGPAVAAAFGGPFAATDLPSGFDGAPFSGRYALVALLPATPDSRGMAVHLNSAQFQYAAKGLQVAAAVAPEKAVDWALTGITLLPASARSTPITYLLSPEGKLLRAWEGYRPAKEIIAAVRALLGEPIGVGAARAGVR